MSNGFGGNVVGHGKSNQSKRWCNRTSTSSNDLADICRKYFQHVHCSSRLYSLLVGQFVFETPCNFTSLQPSRIPLNSGADLGCWTAAVLREKASLARADLLPDARWGMRLDWLMDIHCHCLQKPCQRPLLSNLCVFLGHASKWKEALSWSLIIRIYEDHLDSS